MIPGIYDIYRPRKTRDELTQVSALGFHRQRESFRQSKVLGDRFQIALGSPAFLCVENIPKSKSVGDELPSQF
jgi:hypothetical protein